MSRKRGGLGRGLEGLLRGMDSEGHGMVQEVPVAAIRPNPYQPRKHFDEAALDELAASIRRRGVLQPVQVVREGDGYILIAGERRWRAARKAGLATIPAVVRDLEPAAWTEVALIENLQREDLNPIEEAEAYRLLHEEYGLTQEAIAERVGKSRPHIANMMRLLQLMPAVQDAVRTGQLSIGHAKILAGLPPELQLELAAAAIEKGWTVRHLERQLAARSAFGPRRETASAAARESGLEPLIRKLKEALGAEVTCRPRGAGWRLVIDIPDRAMLERLLEVLQDHSPEDRATGPG
ncbi:MAG TPA: ParB/RepB/Spo0J family partition protein [Calditerricola sp.]|uniref:ParB/RepB/Spo0J family partition protein n=1 Tax=Thermaerobacter sp. FW80 TaxID=2546351 RepID=UPI001074AB65|nr:ParB/RepB/Spo0J family partition protein [Thermaerobacter sp. FW80]QBS38703.1 ParB/RepB/Spo0J family partition protein [Thermaerobacter sp. FW80]